MCSVQSFIHQSESGFQLVTPIVLRMADHVGAYPEQADRFSQVEFSLIPTEPFNGGGSKLT